MRPSGFTQRNSKVKQHATFSSVMRLIASRTTSKLLYARFSSCRSKPNCMQAYAGTVLLQDTHQQGVTGQHPYTNDSDSAKLFAADINQHYLQSTMTVATPCSVPMQALGSLKCKRRILLSGTPVQNNLDEVSVCAAQLHSNGFGHTENACIPPSECNLTWKPGLCCPLWLQMYVMLTIYTVTITVMIVHCACSSMPWLASAILRYLRAQHTSEGTMTGPSWQVGNLVQVTRRCSWHMSARRR